MPITRGSVTSQSQITESVKALFSAIGTSCARLPWSDSHVVGCRPVFGLAEHYRGHGHRDTGHTENQYCGDHMSIPCYTEDGDVFVLEISFHKGETFVERVDFPERPSVVRKARYSLLDSCETR